MTDSAKIIAMRAVVEARIKEEAPDLPFDDLEGSGGPPLTPKDIRNCLANNERGDGILYTAIHRNRFIYNKAMEGWLEFNGHHWSIDYFDRSFAGVEQVAIKYLEEGDKIVPLIEQATEEKRVAKSIVKQANKSLTAATRKQDGAAIIDAKEALAEAERDLSDKEEKLKLLIRDHKGFLERVKRLRGVKGVNNCLKWAHCHESPLACKGDEFDRHPMLLPCENGVIDLLTGRRRDGKPTDMLMRAIPIEWPSAWPHLQAYLDCDPDAPSPCPTWERVFAEVLQDDPEIIDFLGRYLGYIITGLTREQYYLFCIGEGANGKGLIFDALAAILGDLAWFISPELLLEQKQSRNSAGPSADIISLKGRRCVIASESDDNRRISGAMLKRITGEERMTGRSPHDKYEINFDLYFKLIFRTNEVPYGITKGFSMIRRLIYIHFPLMYVDDPEAEARLKPQQAHLFRKKDGTLRDKIKAEYQFILVWLVRECLKYQRDGLHPPDSIRAAVEQLRREEDHFGRFLEECCDINMEDDTYEIPFSEFYNKFKKWYGRYIDEKLKNFPTSNRIGRELTRRGFKRNNTGDRTIYGIIVSDSDLAFSG